MYLENVLGNNNTTTDSWIPNIGETQLNENPVYHNRKGLFYTGLVSSFIFYCISGYYLRF